MRRQPLLLRLGIASLLIGGFALVRNLLSTWQTLEDYPNAQFLPVFLSTQGSNGGETALFTFFVWGPLVFGGLGIALIVAHLGTRAARAGAGAAFVGGAAAASTQAWQQPQQPQQQGWQPQQQGWQPQPQGDAPAQQGWTPHGHQQPEQQPHPWEPQQPQQQANPVQPLGGTQPPPPNASDRIQP